MRPKKKLCVHKERLKDIGGDKLKSVGGAYESAWRTGSIVATDADPQKHSYCKVSD